MLCVVKLSVVMLGIVMLSVMLNVTYKPSMLRVVMLSVVEPFEQLKVNLVLGLVGLIELVEKTSMIGCNLLF